MCQYKVGAGEALGTAVLLCLMLKGLDGNPSQFRLTVSNPIGICLVLLALVNTGTIILANLTSVNGDLIFEIGYPELLFPYTLA